MLCPQDATAVPTGSSSILTNPPGDGNRKEAKTVADGVEFLRHARAVVLYVVLAAELSDIRVCLDREAVLSASFPLVAADLSRTISH